LDKILMLLLIVLCSCTDNIRSLWDTNSILPQSLSFWDGYASMSFTLSSPFDSWWNIEGLPIEKTSTIKSAEALKVKSQIMD